MQLNDDADEVFRIYGYSCSGYGCGEFSGNQLHYFNASGDAWHSSAVFANIYYDRYNTGYYFYGRTDSRVYRWNADYLYSYNWIFAQGDIIAYYSDERLKTKVGAIENALDKVSKLNGFYYVNNDLAKSFGYVKDTQQVGLSAQEVQSVLPEVVCLAPFDTKTDKEGNVIGSKSGENYLTVQYDKIVPLLVESIKELKAQLDETRAELAELKKLNK
jgi:hypothetical protein